MNRIKHIYRQLLKPYGPQGWWPLLDLGTINYKPGTKNYGGYHPGDYSYPRTNSQAFEICIGAILTQNTAWNNVQRALVNLKSAGALSPNKLLTMNNQQLTSAIKPAGYYNQKAKKLRIFAEFFIQLDRKQPTRNDLLSLWGIGPETADSMLLYAFKVPAFVVDAYTRRILTNIGLIKEKATYDEIKALFESNLPKDYTLYQEYHALIVEHAKRNY